MRWRQTKDGLVPIDASAAKAGGHYVRDDYAPFVSPLDGTVVSGRKQYDEHCKKHGVVNAAEFDDAHYAKAAKRRADHYNGVSSRAETQERRENINNIITHLELRG